MTTQPPPSAADLLEQCAEVLRKHLPALRHSMNLSDCRSCDAVAALKEALAAIDSHRAQSAEVAGDGPVAWLTGWQFNRNADGSIAVYTPERDAALVYADPERNGKFGSFVLRKLAGAILEAAPVRLEEARTARGGVTEAVERINDLPRKFRIYANGGGKSWDGLAAFTYCADEVERLGRELEAARER